MHVFVVPHQQDKDRQWSDYIAKTLSKMALSLTATFGTDTEGRRIGDMKSLPVPNLVNPSLNQVRARWDATTLHIMWGDIARNTMPVEGSSNVYLGDLRGPSAVEFVHLRGYLGAAWDQLQVVTAYTLAIDACRRSPPRREIVLRYLEHASTAGIDARKNMQYVSDSLNTLMVTTERVYDRLKRQPPDASPAMACELSAADLQ